ncbi:maleylacetoacetate isomerase [Microvirga flavescens]|uniref:maleylacetoacetate isomerase n=1 Tax=Microvirga flavescens TaxID=2249811 RepID=UPI000DD59A0F|nr:maleylacetoacetate isomerase [Microvirga flavescens]
MKLYSYFRSSAAYRVRIALNLKGLSYSAVPVNLRQGEQLEAPYRSINPQGRVPALDIGDTILTQSPAILEYLEETHPEPPFLPADPEMRARIRAVSAIVGCDIHPLNNLSVLQYLKHTLGHDQAQIDAWYAHWIRQGFDAIERLIRPGSYAFGAHPTLADIYIVPQVFNARRMDMALDAYPNIVAVDAACSGHPAFQAAAPDQQPDAV